MTREHREAYLTTADGLELFHRFDGPSQPKLAVMLLHGLGEHSGRYEHVIARLNDADIAVYAIDHRGHGRSDGERAFVRSYDEFMSDLARFRRHVDDDRGDTPLVVLGHSMGGNLAVGHCLEQPAGVSGLALSGPALIAGDDIGAVQQKVLRGVAKLAPQLRPQALDATLISRDQQVVDAYLADPLVHSGKLTTGIAAALLGAMAEFAERFDELTMPILVQHGTADGLADVEGSRRLESRAVNADVTAHYYEGLYHEVFNEPEQERVLGDLVRWLDARVR